ncbi:MAG: glycosyltransferase, partial [Pseudomonadota bacterium]
MAWLTGGTDAVLRWVSEEEAAARAIPQAVFHRLLAGRALSEAAAWAETTGGPEEAEAAIALLSARPEEAETFLVPVLERQEPEARTLSLWELSVKTALALGPSGAECAATRLSQAKRLFPNRLSLDQLAAEAALQDGDWTRATACLHGRPGPGQSPARGRAQADLAHRIGSFSPGASGAQAVRHALDRGDLEAAAVQLQALSRLWWDEQVQALRLEAELAVLHGDLNVAQATCDALEKLDPIRPATAHLCTRVALLRGDQKGAAAHRAQFRARRAVDVAGVRLESLRDVPDLMLTPPVTEQGTRTARAVARLSQMGPGQEPDQMPKAPIPAQILSYWEGPRSAPIERISQAWRDHHPHLAWRSFDGDQAATWIADHASEQVQTAFQQALGPAQRADIFRLAVLAQDGGLYVDLDDLPRASVSPLLSDANLVLVQEPGHGAIANNFMGGCPGHPLCVAALEEIVTTPPAHGVETWTVSGPGLMARALAESLETNPEAFSSFRRVPWARYA